MLEDDDARVLARLALALPDHRGRRTQRVADQDRLREAHLFPTEVPERRAVGGVVHREADQEPEREYAVQDRKSTRLNSSHSQISYAVFCLKKKKYKNSTHCST